MRDDGLPQFSVVVCTTGASVTLGETLAAVATLDGPSYEVVVVDNAPERGVVPSLVGRHGGRDVPFVYVAEARRGLSRARNTGLAQAAGEFVAWTDDDAVPRRDWLQALEVGFARDARVAAVTGLVLPADLDTEARRRFESLGGHTKGRGREPLLFNRDGPQAQHPLFPVPAYGAGVNMAFRTDVLRQLGGFDPALGAGTRSCAGEDTAALGQVLLSGASIAYEPDAVVFHYHRVDLDSLRQQVLGYGVGLTAYATWCLTRYPREAPALLRALSREAGHRRRDRGGRRSPDEISRRLSAARRRGMLLGPFEYALARGAARARVR